MLPASLAKNLMHKGTLQLWRMCRFDAHKGKIFA